MNENLVYFVGPLQRLNANSVDLLVLLESRSLYLLTLYATLMQFFASEHAVLRRLALGTVNQFIVLLPAVSWFYLTFIRKQVCTLKKIAFI